MLNKTSLDFDKLKHSDRIKLLCDYCDKKFTRKYGDHIRITEKDEFVKKNACRKCNTKKQIEIADLKQSMGLLKRGDFRYYKYKENILKELDSFINEFGHAHIHKHPNGHDIYMGIVSRKDGYGLMDAISDLGYDYLDVLNYIPRGYMDDFKVLEKYIQKFIDENNRFPTKIEINKTIGISDGILQKHGGIFEIKRKMNYFNEDDLIDNNNFINKSVYEFIVAQFLIKNEIPYKREQYPFENRLYKSDFTFYPIDEDEIHVEVWGFRDEGYGEKYNKRKREKKRLYKEYNIRLIEIEHTIFENYNHKRIQKYLEEIFSDYFTLKYKDLDYRYFIASKLSDEEIFEEIMGLSNDGELPRTHIIKKYSSSLYIEMINRFGNYTNFALRFDKEPFEKNNYWNKEVIHKHLLDIVNSGKQLKQDNIKKHTKGLFKAMIRHKGMTDSKLEFFDENISKLSRIHSEDIRQINRIIKSDSYTLERRILAKQILEKYNSKFEKELIHN